MKTMIDFVEKGFIPDFFIRKGIVDLCKKRIVEDIGTRLEDRSQRVRRHIDLLKNSPIAVNTAEANQQHYELPPEFFGYALGKNRKYSACYWPDGVKTLDEAEDLSLNQICERAQLQDGQDVLELGCGWGSLSLWMAKKYPNSKITGVSNSAPQRKYIMQEAEKRGLKNIEIITADINVFQAQSKFDRIVSIEMFEHIRNYEQVMQKVYSWLKDGGKFFVHVFAHREVPYFFETEGDDNWMGRYFFTGGQMPSHDLLLYFHDKFKIENHWALNGVHYAKTSDAWLENMDRHREEIMKVFEKTYGKDAKIWWNRWRVFFMAVAELFRYKKGEEWIVSHLLLSK